MPSHHERREFVFCSHITSETATLLPVHEVVELARRAGAVSIVDGAHAPGHIPLGVDAIGADVYAGNAHKWLCAPKGSAFLHVADDAQEWVRPTRDHESVERCPSRHRSRRALLRGPGTYDPTAVLSIPAAIAYQAERDWEPGA